MEDLLYISVRCNTLLAELPDYISGYASYKKDYVKEYTLFRYLTALSEFVSFFHFPALYDVLAFTSKDIDEFRKWLRTCGNSSSSVKMKLSAVASFYKYAICSDLSDHNPVTSDTRPAATAYVSGKLDEFDIAQLLSGIRRNDMYLCTYPSDGSKNVLPIIEKVRVHKSVFLTRNIAIILLALRTGMTLSETAALDLDDIDLDRQRVHIRHGMKRTLPFPPDVKDALDEYINTEIPEQYYTDYGQKYFDMLSWCRDHIYVSDVARSAKYAFPDEDDSFYESLSALMKDLRSCGRRSIKIHMGETALFISKDGKRISARMIEHMFKEMVRTYLPDHPCLDSISFRSLRDAFIRDLVLKEPIDQEYAAHVLGYNSTKMLSKTPPVSTNGLH